MLSYLHGFHAGNAADVFKHSALVSCLAYLKKKEKPLLCVDTHAGAGLYDLAEAGFPQNREWENGIGRLLREEPLPPMLASYVNSCYADRRYSGSPLIMAGMLEKKDRLVCFELHPGEFETLKASLAAVRTNSAAAGPVKERPVKEKPLVELRREDGLAGLRGLLPPPSRRGLVFIDPSWEERQEFETIPQAVLEGLMRFPGGTFIIWYPLLAKEKAAASAAPADALYDLMEAKRCRAELYTNSPRIAMAADNFPGSSPRGMYGSGLVIYNPPWTLRPALEETLPFLARILGGANGGWRLDWDAS